jgi:hypothetical protein
MNNVRSTTDAGNTTDITCPPWCEVTDWEHRAELGGAAGSTVHHRKHHELELPSGSTLEVSAHHTLDLATHEDDGLVFMVEASGVDFTAEDALELAAGVERFVRATGGLDEPDALAS